VRTLSDRSRFLSGFLHKLSDAPLAVDPDARAHLRLCGSSFQVSNSSTVSFYLLVEEHDYHCAGFTHGPMARMRRKKEWVLKGERLEVRASTEYLKAKNSRVMSGT
jgi:hypothetical protein